MGSLMRLLVGAGLFAFGYYLGRQSSRLESMQDQPDAFEDPAPADKPVRVKREKQGPGH